MTMDRPVTGEPWTPVSVGDEREAARGLADFVLALDFKISKGCNSGIFIRTGSAKDPVQTGIEIQVPEYITNGERVLVNTATGEFAGRAD